MKYTDLYFEYYTMLSLKHCYNHNWDGFTFAMKSKGPDLKNYKLNLGIEVTCAISCKEGEELSILNKYFGLNKNGHEIVETLTTKYRGFKGRVGTIDGLAYCETQINTSDKLVELAKSISAKLSKLNKEYEKFERNCLYVFVDTALLSSDEIHKCINDVCKKCEYSDLFDLIFINCIDKLVVYNRAEEDNVSIIDIDEQLLCFFKKEARILSETSGG